MLKKLKDINNLPRRERAGKTPETLVQLRGMQIETPGMQNGRVYPAGSRNVLEPTPGEWKKNEKEKGKEKKRKEKKDERREKKEREAKLLGRKRPFKKGPIASGNFRAQFLLRRLAYVKNFEQRGILS